MKKYTVPIIILVVVSLLCFAIGYTLGGLKSEPVTPAKLGQSTNLLDFQLRAQQYSALATTSLSSFYNGDGKDRYITGLYELFPQESATLYPSWGTSTNPYNITGTKTFTGWVHSSSTSAMPAYNYSASAATVSQLNVWANGVYLNFTSTTTDATSTGIFGVTYIAQ
jgi:hypothetical protein